MSSAGPRIAVIDYGMGNRRSVQKGLEHAGASVSITSQRQELEEADGLVLPGVGAFPRAMANLRELGLVDVIQAGVARAVPLLGICLGMQLLFERSEEGEPTAGLGLMAGQVTWLEAGSRRIPHIGWNEVALDRPSRLTSGLPERGCPFYHVHSLAVRPADEAQVIGTTEYGERFTTIAERDQVFGVQFHPEKSSGAGLRLLGNFVALCGAGDARREETPATAGAGE